MTLAYIQPFDLKTIFVDLFAGDTTLFVFVAALLMSGLAARFRMPSPVFLVLLALFGIILSSVTTTLYAVVVIIGSLIVFYSIGSLVKR